jgi:benzodiazapine receptor
MRKTLKLAAVLIATFGAGLVGMLFVGTSVGDWYFGLLKPAFTPPDVIFPSVWALLYFLSAIACALVWRKEPQNTFTEGWVRFYFIQLMLNAGWTIFFFGMRNITLAFVDNLVLAFMVIALTRSSWEIDRRVTYLMLPYVLWLLFALYLTAGVWLLN